MFLNWLFSSCSAHLHDEGPIPPPPSAAQCWQTLCDINSESQYRYSLGQGATLEDQKNRAIEALFTLVRYHGQTLTAINDEMRQRRLSLIWLYAVPHSVDPECATVCRDALTHEPRSHSVAVHLGPESEYILIRQSIRASPPLGECGFLELK